MRRLIDTKAVCAALGGIDPSTLHRWRVAGIVPEPLKLGKRMVKWDADEIEAVVERLATERNKPEPTQGLRK